MSKNETSIRPADALKSLENITVVDPRNKHIEISEWHARIAEITLNDSTPIEVKQLFENAKNIALYAYYAYRLHQPAEAIGYSALEKAIKLKFDQEKNNISYKQYPKRLMDYMNIALEQEWITDEGYESSREIAKSRVEKKKFFDLIDSGAFHDKTSIPVPEPKEDEIVNEMRSMNLAEQRLHTGRYIRNYLAHGDGGLSPSSIATLGTIAEEINQLFKNRY